MKEYSVDTTSRSTYAPWGVWEGNKDSAAKILLCKCLERETAERISRLLWAEELIDLVQKQVGEQ